MSDPRLNDPRYSDPRLSGPVLRRDEGVGGPWGWIAGAAVIVLIAFMVIVGWHGNRDNTASTNSPAATSGSAMRQMAPPSTTGSGAGSLQPLTPAPAAPPTPPAGETK
jgi:hypothetical protein